MTGGPPDTPSSLTPTIKRTSRTAFYLPWLRHCTVRLRTGKPHPAIVSTSLLSVRACGLRLFSLRMSALGGEQVQVDLARLDQVIGELAVSTRRSSSRSRCWRGGSPPCTLAERAKCSQTCLKAQAEWTKGAQLPSEGIKGLHSASTQAHRSFAETIAANKARFS